MELCVIRHAMLRQHPEIRVA